MNRDFLVNYANWEGLSRVYITIDIDFAPEYMIANLVEMLQEYGVCATFFSTHDSGILNALGKLPEFEIGTHPNLSSNSTQGKTLKEIIEYIRNPYDGFEIRGNRFHLLAYSYRDLFTLGEMGFVYDVSTLHYNLPYGLPVFHKDLNLVLFTYTWEDGVCESSGYPMRLDSIDLHTPGIKIINFHPMNVFINSPGVEGRLKFQRENPDLLNCTMGIAEKYRQKGEGAAFVLRELLKYIKSNDIKTGCLKELASEYRLYNHV